MDTGEAVAILAKACAALQRYHVENFLNTLFSLCNNMALYLTPLNLGIVPIMAVNPA
jgi:hypothetical protein